MASSGGDSNKGARHSVREIERKWTQLKLMRDLDVDRLNNFGA